MFKRCRAGRLVVIDLLFVIAWIVVTAFVLFGIITAWLIIGIKIGAIESVRLCGIRLLSNGGSDDG